MSSIRWAKGTDVVVGVWWRGGCGCLIKQILTTDSSTSTSNTRHERDDMS